MGEMHPPSIPSSELARRPLISDSSPLSNDFLARSTHSPPSPGRLWSSKEAVTISSPPPLPLSSTAAAAPRFRYAFGSIQDFLPPLSRISGADNSITAAPLRSAPFVLEQTLCPIETSPPSRGQLPTKLHFSLCSPSSRYMHAVPSGAYIFWLAVPDYCRAVFSVSTSVDGRKKGGEGGG